jgi:hypothetical protein
MGETTSSGAAPGIGWSIVGEREEVNSGRRVESVFQSELGGSTRWGLNQGLPDVQSAVLRTLRPSGRRIKDTPCFCPPRLSYRELGARLRCVAQSWHTAPDHTELNVTRPDIPGQRAHSAVNDEHLSPSSPHPASPPTHHGSLTLFLLSSIHSLLLRPTRRHLRPHPHLPLLPLFTPDPYLSRTHLSPFFTPYSESSEASG